MVKKKFERIYFQTCVTAHCSSNELTMVKSDYSQKWNDFANHFINKVSVCIYLSMFALFSTFYFINR